MGYLELPVTPIAIPCILRQTCHEQQIRFYVIMCGHQRGLVDDSRHLNEVSRDVLEAGMLSCRDYVALNVHILKCQEVWSGTHTLLTCSVQ